MNHLERFLEEDDDIDEVNFILFQRFPRTIYERPDLFRKYDNFSFFQRFRLTKPTVLQLLIQIEDQLEYMYDKNNSISPMNQLLACLRMYSTGGQLITVADFLHSDKATVSRIIVKVSEAIARLAPQYIKFPRTDNEIKNEQNKFYEISLFPRIVGVIDCSHIKMQSPGGADPEIYRNRKGYFSINVQAITNANLQFTNIVARWPGSAHDSTIFNSSLIRAQFENGMYPNSLLLGDSGYEQRTYLFTPLLNTNTEAERLYNEALTRTRVKIENVFGIWKRRFPILAYGCRLKLETLLTIIVSTAVLHNIAREQNEVDPPNDPEINQHDLQRLIGNGQIPAIPNANQRGNIGFQIRQNFIQNYFRLLRD